MRKAIRGAALALAAFHCLPALAAPAPLRPLAPTLSFLDVLQVLLGLALVLGAIFGSAWLLRRVGYGQKNADGLMQVVSVIGVGTKERLVLVQVENDWLLLGVAPGRVSMLHRMDKPAGAPAPMPPQEGKRFMEMLLKNVKR